MRGAHELDALEAKALYLSGVLGAQLPIPCNDEAPVRVIGR